VVDGGGLFWRSAKLAESQLEATRIKGALVADSFASSGIDAIGLTPSDLAIGWEQVKQLASEHQLPYLAANFSCGGEPPYPGTRVVERGGVSIGFVGAYLGPVPQDAAGCEVTEAIPAVQTAIAGLAPVDLVVVLGAWDAKNAEALAEAVPAMDFIVTASNLTLPEGRPLTQDDWMLGAGSRGKKIGLLTGELIPGASGWQGASPGAALADRIDSYKKRLSSNEERLSTATEERAQQRAERQVAFYKKEIERLEAELAAATAPRAVPANSFTTSLESLGKDIADHEATLAKVAACNSELEQKGLVDDKEPPKRVELPAGALPGRPGLQESLLGAEGHPRLGVKGGPLVPPEIKPLEQPAEPPVEPAPE
jgi:2',3'-cyclic-nucleotide 2'-phosphodiesterase (5'-nucleotidase family)